jgi:NAD(P)-dependent dehydrogenase (short-subunit alcohol dehydrogenase family)
VKSSGTARDRVSRPEQEELRGSGFVSRVGALSSMGGQMSFAGFAAYSATKFALEGMSEEVAQEVAPFGIKVLIVEPGAFRTSLFTNLSTAPRSPATKPPSDLPGR